MTDRIIFACDYEDTYNLEVGKHPKESEVQAVRKFRAEGNLFGLVCERDVFEALANMGEYEEEYDFIVCSTGAALVVRLPVTPGGYGAPTRICTDTANPYFLCELHDLFLSVGASLMAIDVFGFKGGDAEGARLNREYSPTIGMGCYSHYWGGGGVYHVYGTKRESLIQVTPFSQCRATFKNHITAEGVAKEVNRRYDGSLRAYASGNFVTVIPAEADKSKGVARFAEFVGASRENVWTFGNGSEDAAMLREFNGIAMKGGHPSALAAAKHTASSVAEAIEIILK